MADLQERITSTQDGSITSVQAVYVLADDFTDPASHTTFAHLDATIELDCALASKGIYPVVAPSASKSTMLDPTLISPKHCTVESFSKMVEGRHDDLPEQAFYMIGGIEEAIEKAKTF